jgi:CIC family chloride channel protein
MGSVLAATVHSPLLAMIMIFEISLNYSVMPPLMLSCAISTLVARRLHPESIYTAPLRRKGVTEDNPQLGDASQKTVGEIMREPVPPIRATAPFREVADRFLTTTFNFLPVVDLDDRLIGVIALHDLKEHLHTNGNVAGSDEFLNNIIAYDLMRPPPDCLTPNQRLPEVFPVLLRSELRNVPVINHPNDRRLVGSIQRAEALALLSEAISAKPSTEK